jgi:hypothetical protein
MVFGGGSCCDCGDDGSEGQDLGGSGEMHLDSGLFDLNLRRWKIGPGSLELLEQVI